MALKQELVVLCLLSILASTSATADDAKRAPTTSVSVAASGVAPPSPAPAPAIAAEAHTAAAEPAVPMGDPDSAAPSDTIDCFFAENQYDKECAK
jgi:hypothetical protein